VDSESGSVVDIQDSESGSVVFIQDSESGSVVVIQDSESAVVIQDSESRSAVVIQGSESGSAVVIQDNGSGSAVDIQENRGPGAGDCEALMICCTPVATPLPHIHTRGRLASSVLGCLETRMSGLVLSSISHVACPAERDTWCGQDRQQCAASWLHCACTENIDVCTIARSCESCITCIEHDEKRGEGEGGTGREGLDERQDDEHLNTSTCSNVSTSSNTSTSGTWDGCKTVRQHHRSQRVSNCSNISTPNIRDERVEKRSSGCYTSNVVGGYSHTRMMLRQDGGVTPTGSANTSTSYTPDTSTTSTSFHSSEHNRSSDSWGACTHPVGGASMSTPTLSSPTAVVMGRRRSSKGHHSPHALQSLLEGGSTQHVRSLRSYHPHSTIKNNNTNKSFVATVEGDSRISSQVRESGFKVFLKIIMI